MPEVIRQNESSAPPSAALGESTAPELVEVFHDIGTEVADVTVERSLLIDRTSPPSEVVFRSHLITSSARVLKSPTYLASKRRRRATKIARLIRDLETHADASDFAVWTQEPLDQLRRLIQEIADAEEHVQPEHEGNSCEILRQLRDTFLNTGWERYRDPAIRNTAGRILNRLADQEEVTADDADESMDMLLDMNLNPSVGLTLRNVETEEEEVPS